jgi:hypothetical protein
MQQRPFKVMLLFILVVLASASTASTDEQSIQEAPMALFEDDSKQLLAASHAIVPSKMTTLQLLFHPSKPDPTLQHRIAKRAAELEFLSGIPAAAAELSSSKEARTWASHSDEGFVLDVHVVLWMDPSRYKTERDVRRQLFKAAVSHFGVPRRELRMHLAEYVTFEHKHGRATKHAIEEVVAEEDLGDYLKDTWGFQVSATDDPIRFMPKRANLAKPAPDDEDRFGPVEVELFFEGDRIQTRHARSWAKMLQARATKGRVVDGKQRWPRVGGAMVIEVKDHYQFLRTFTKGGVESPWTGRAPSAKITLSLAMTPASFMKGGRERVMADLARYFTKRRKDHVAALGKLIQVDMRSRSKILPAHHLLSDYLYDYLNLHTASPIEQIAQETPLAKVVNDPPLEDPISAELRKFDAALSDVKAAEEQAAAAEAVIDLAPEAAAPAKSKTFAEACRMWSVALLGAGVAGMLVSALLMARGPRFPTAKVELLRTAYTKAAQ